MYIRSLEENMINLFLPKNWQNSEKNLKIYNHSLMVANAAKKIASRTTHLDPDKSYTYGLMHDVGKIFLSKEIMYQHPRIGYEKLKDAHPDIAEICISHGFPDFDLFEHILHYCHNCEEEAQKVSKILKNIKMNDYIQLIQFCDKVSTLDNYVTFEMKLNWYMETYQIEEDELVRCYAKKFTEIKLKFDKMAGIDIYELLEIIKE